MDLFKISGLVSLIANVSLGLFVYFKNPREPLAVRFSALSLSIAFWSAGSSYANLFPDRAVALWALRQSYLFGAFLPALFLHFVLTLSGWVKRLRFFLVASYFFAAVLAVFALSPYFIAGVRVLEPFSYFIDVPGPLYFVFAVFFVSVVFGTLVLLLLFFRRADKRQRKQLRYILIAYFFGALAGVEYFLSVFQFLKRPPVDDYVLIITFASMSYYVIVRYRWLDIRVIIKKTLIFAGLFSFVFGAFAGSSLLVTGILQESVAASLRWPFLVLVGIFVAALLRPLENLLIQVTDRFLFQRREDFRKILNRLSQRIITILNLDEVAKTVLETFRDSLRSESGAILLKNESDYRVLNSFGLFGRGGKANYSAQDPLIQHFRSHPEVMDLESGETYQKLPLAVSGALGKLAASIAIPLFLHGELIGLLTLGKKKSDQEYTAEEIEYFPTVAGQVAIALSNSRLYEEAVEARKKIEAMQLELIHREKMAFVADLVKGIAHEVFNPLTPIYHAIGDLETEVLVGLFETFKRLEPGLDPEIRQEYLKGLRALRFDLETLKVNSEHIHLVIDTLDKLRKEDKETIGPMDFKMFLKDSRALIGMELHREEREIPVIEDIQRRLPPAKGNPTLLAQVFVNLFKNAIDAMEGVQEKKITVKADVDPERPGFLRIDFTDTGRGISADTLPRIFDFGFTTKGKQGQGIGLAQCKLIIEKFGGAITCSSEVGIGTTFTLRLPLWKEK